MDVDGLVGSRREAQTRQNLTPGVDVMSSDSQHALDSIDHFIGVARRISGVPALADRPGVAEDLYIIAGKLLKANENMTRWLHRFLLFDFRGQDARSRFLSLLEEYRTTKAGPGFHDMKYSCGDIFLIYERNIKGDIPTLFPDDAEKRATSEAAFYELADADADMVAFIHETVVGQIDAFVRDVEDRLDRSDLNAAEERRLRFKVDSASLTGRLERFASELSDLVLTYARLARRPVTLS